MHSYLFKKFIPAVAIKKQINLYVVNTFFALSIGSYYVGMRYVPEEFYWPKYIAKLYVLQEGAQLINQETGFPANLYAFAHYHPTLRVGDIAALRVSHAQGIGHHLKMEQGSLFQRLQTHSPIQSFQAFENQFYGEKTFHLNMVSPSFPTVRPMEEAVTLMDLHTLLSHYMSAIALELTPAHVKSFSQERERVNCASQPSAPLPLSNPPLVAQNPVIPNVQVQSFQGESNILHSPTVMPQPPIVPHFQAQTNHPVEALNLGNTVVSPQTSLRPSPPEEPNISIPVADTVQALEENAIAHQTTVFPSSTPDTSTELLGSCSGGMGSRKNPLVKCLLDLLKLLAGNRTPTSETIVSPLAPTLVSQEEPLLSWSSYMLQVRNDRNPLLKFWLMKVAPGGNVKPEELRFRRALKDVLLEFQDYINESLEEDDDAPIKEIRRSIHNSYMKRVLDPVMMQSIFGVDYMQRAFTAQDFLDVDPDLYMKAYNFPLRLGITVYKDEDLPV